MALEVRQAERGQAQRVHQRVPGGLPFVVLDVEQAHVERGAGSVDRRQTAAEAARAIRRLTVPWEAMALA